MQVSNPATALKMMDNKPENYALEMKTATKIFAAFKNDLDFLTKVKPPSWVKSSISYFLSQEGKAFLDLKYKEFYFKIETPEKFVDLGEKVGDDIVVSKPLTIRNFLNE